MLREDVLAAAKEGKFHIYPISTIDEGIELLTDVPAGKPDKNGEYPIGTINRRVKNRLETFYQKSAPPKGFNSKEER
jgi:predicted ATP-dependent protease